MHKTYPSDCCERWQRRGNLAVTAVYIAQKPPFNKVSKVSHFQEAACKENIYKNN